MNKLDNRAIVSDEEIWKPIIDFPGYEVSNMGQVRSYYTRRGHKGWRIADAPQRNLKFGFKKRGYPFVHIKHKDGNYRAKLIHQLVLLSFVGSCPDGLEVCHNDGDPANNNLSNLRYDTRKANLVDAARHGAWGLDEKSIIALREERAARSSSQELAKKYNLSVEGVLRICRGETYCAIDGPITKGPVVLLEADILSIREKRQLGRTLQSIADEYKVDQSTISLIVRGLRRKDVGGPIEVSQFKRFTNNMNELNTNYQNFTLAELKVLVVARLNKPVVINHFNSVLGVLVPAQSEEGAIAIIEKLNAPDCNCSANDCESEQK